MLGKVRVGSLANLRPPWRKGECPNPAGRPPNVPLARAYRVLLRSFERGDRAARVYVRRLAQALHDENTESISRGRAGRAGCQGCRWKEAHLRGTIRKESPGSGPV